MPGDAVTESKTGRQGGRTQIPTGMLDDLSPADQEAISAVMGKQIKFNHYDGDGRAELEFKDPLGNIHFK